MAKTKDELEKELEGLKEKRDEEDAIIEAKPGTAKKIMKWALTGVSAVTLFVAGIFTGRAMGGNHDDDDPEESTTEES